MPLEIQSDSVTFDEQKGSATYVGHVVTTQGSRQLTSDTLVIFRDNHGKVEWLYATGHPALFHAKPDPTKPMTSGQANIIKFFPKLDKVILLKEATLIQNEQSIQGDNLIYSPSNHLLSAEPVPGKKTTVILPPKTNSPSLQ